MMALHHQKEDSQNSTTTNVPPFTFTTQQLQLSNYQRRAPFTAINILRADQLIVDLDIGGGVTQKSSGIITYCRNAIHLANVGEHTLQEGVDSDMAMAYNY